MGCDLERFFASLAARLPEIDGEPFELSARTLPCPPPSLRTNRLVIERTYHAYDSYCRRDALAFYADKTTYCQLGLLIAAVLFAPTASDVVLLLEHPRTDIRQITMRRDGAIQPGTLGFHSQPLVLNYLPAAVAKHPWEDFAGNPRELPGFFLTNTAELVMGAADWEVRDALIGFGSDWGFARFAELLLNATREGSEKQEFELEGEGGFRGVAPFSCEVRLWLPGAFGWKAELWAT